MVRGFERPRKSGPRTIESIAAERASYGKIESLRVHFCTNPVNPLDPSGCSHPAKDRYTRLRSENPTMNLDSPPVLSIHENSRLCPIQRRRRVELRYGNQSLVQELTAQAA